MIQCVSRVMTLDLSENMLSRAKAETADPGVRYLPADLESLELPAQAFDLAYSSLALHYVEDFGRLVGRVFRGLGPGGHFVLTIGTPIYTASMKAGRHT